MPFVIKKAFYHFMISLHFYLSKDFMKARIKSKKQLLNLQRVKIVISLSFYDLGVIFLSKHIIN